MRVPRDIPDLYFPYLKDGPAPEDRALAVIMAMTEDELAALVTFISYRGTNHVTGVFEGLLLQRLKDQDANRPHPT